MKLRLIGCEVIMNIQKIFEAVGNEPDQPTLIVAVTELERQGFSVNINNKNNGSTDLLAAEERDELKYLPHINGVVLKLIRGKEAQVLRMHFLDIDSIAFTEIKSLPLQYNRKYTIELFTQG